MSFHTTVMFVITLPLLIAPIALNLITPEQEAAVIDVIYSANFHLIGSITALGGILGLIIATVVLFQMSLRRFKRHELILD